LKKKALCQAGWREKPSEGRERRINLSTGVVLSFKEVGQEESKLRGLSSGTGRPEDDRCEGRRLRRLGAKEGWRGSMPAQKSAWNGILNQKALRFGDPQEEMKKDVLGNFVQIAGPWGFIESWDTCAWCRELTYPARGESESPSQGH